MIKKITVTNQLQESIELELRFPEKSGFLVRDISGLTPPKADINISQIATNDGAMFNSAHVYSRNIVLDLIFSLNQPIEDTRLKSYKFFPIKQRIDIQIETTNRLCRTYGYVESNEPSIFTSEPNTSVSIVCPDSYFYSFDKNITVFSGTQKLFEFPFENNSPENDLEHVDDKQIEFGRIQLSNTATIQYVGDAPIGIVAFIHAIGTVINPSIINTRTGELFKINSARLLTLTGSADIVEGDNIILSTVKGDKFLYLQRGGQLINILSCIGDSSDWFQLQRGDNLFAYTADDGVENLQFRIENQIAYEGV